MVEAIGLTEACHGLPQHAAAPRDRRGDSRLLALSAAGARGGTHDLRADETMNDPDGGVNWLGVRDDFRNDLIDAA
jgi:hypothetical protein